MFGKGYSDDPTTNISNIKNSVVQNHFGSKDTKGTAAVMEVLRQNPEFSYGSGKDAVKVGYPAAVVQKALELTKEDSAFLGMGGGYNDNYKKAFKANLDKVMSGDDVWKQYTTYNNIRANYLEGTGPGSALGASLNIPKPTSSQPEVSTSSSSAAIDRAASEARKGSAPSTPSSEPQKILAELSAKNPKANALWVNGERYKYQSVTDADNNVTGNAWVRDTGVGGLLSSGVSNARARNGYTGEDSGTDVKSSAATAETLKAALKNSVGVTNAPAEQPKVSVPVATNIGKAPVPVKASDTVAFAPDGTSTPAPPINPSKAEIKALGSPETVVAAYKGAIPKGQGTKVLVTMVGDGDTFNFNPTDPNQKVPGSVGNVCRFDLIDAPETAHPSVGKKGQPYGPEAASYLRQMIENKEVNIRVTGQAKRNDTDKARNLCQVEIEGKGVDLELVKAGFAMVYTDFVKGNDRGDALKSAEAKASTNGIGQFKGGGYVQPPWDFRRIQNRLNK